MKTEILFTTTRILRITKCVQNYCGKRRFFNNNLLVNYENMPKTAHIVNLQDMHRKRKNHTMRHRANPGRITMEILGSGALGGGKSLLLTTDHNKYMFNCGEGTQRLANEYRSKLTKLEHILLTTSNWSNMGGLVGMLLTLQDSGVPDMKFHCPQGTLDFFSMVCNFASLTSFDIIEAPVDEFEPYSDEILSIEYIRITNSNDTTENNSDLAEDISESADDGGFVATTTNENGKRQIAATNEQNKVPRVEPEINRISEVLSYVCKLHPRRGALSLEKCVEMGITRGPQYGELKAGRSVQLENGKIVTSDDVCMPTLAAVTFLVVDCPTEDYLDSFVQHPSFNKYQNTGAEEDKPLYIFHFTSGKIRLSNSYREWMSKFSSDTTHVILNDENTCLGSEAVYKAQHQLQQLNRDVFPSMGEEWFTKEEKTLPEETARIHHARTMHRIQLRPANGLDVTLEATLHHDEYMKELDVLDGYEETLAELKSKIAKLPELSNPTEEYPKVIMLGTGCSVPNKVRNTSGILLRIDEKHSILLDCGEGTLGQIVRFYGSSANDILSTIKGIYVSHMHTDHHVGCISLLQARATVTDEPVHLIAPDYMFKWLKSYDSRFESIVDKFIPVSNVDLLMNKHPSASLCDIFSLLKLKEIKTCYVKHCVFSFGVSITLTDGKKIVYSGDTMPCDFLVRLGENCDLLIHEATMQDELEAEAAHKYHSTTSQAIKIGKLMNAKFVLLTHFSQRYSKIPQIPEDENVGLAYDNMQIPLSQLPILPLLHPCLKIVYHEHYDRMERRVNGSF